MTNSAHLHRFLHGPAPCGVYTYRWGAFFGVGCVTVGAIGLYWMLRATEFTPIAVLVFLFTVTALIGGIGVLHQRRWGIVIAHLAWLFGLMGLLRTPLEWMLQWMRGDDVSPAGSDLATVVAVTLAVNLLFGIANLLYFRKRWSSLA